MRNVASACVGHVVGKRAHVADDERLVRSPGHRPLGREPRRIRTVRQRQPVAAIPFVIGGRHGARDAEQTLRPADKAAQVAVHLPEALWVGCLEASRSEEHTSELQALMRNTYADCGLKKKKK